jgi:hypothetical protein
VLPGKCNNGSSSNSNSGVNAVAQYSLTTSTVQRSAGSSAVAHAAYISGGRLMDAHSGKEADYTRRDGVECVAPAIVLPADERETLSAQLGREELWNMAESAEKRKDGSPARKILVALPSELRQQVRLAMTQEYAQWVADRYHVAVDFAIHVPDVEGDQRNYHAHLLTTTREIQNGTLGEKAKIEWNGTRLKKEGLPTGMAMVHELRQRWEAIQNDFLTRNAPEIEQVSCKSLMAQRGAMLREAAMLQRQGREPEAQLAKWKATELDREPQQHVGWEATAMEGRLEREKKQLTAKHKSIAHLPAFATRHGAERNAIQQEAAQKRSLLAELRQWWEKGKAAIRDLVQQPATKNAEIERQQNIAWMQEQHPEVLKMKVSKAEQWFEHRLWKTEVTEQARQKFTARELFNTDDGNPQSVQLRMDQRTIELLQLSISSREKSLQEQPKEGLFSRKSEHVKAWKAELTRLIPQRDAAKTSINTIEKWWDKEGAGIYEEKKEAQHKEVDKLIESKEQARKNLTRVQESTMLVMREWQAKRIKAVKLDPERHPKKSRVQTRGGRGD